MWSVRLVTVTLLALMFWAMFVTGRLLGVDARSIAAGLAFGLLAGVPVSLLVLLVARASAPTVVADDDEPYAPQLPPRGQLEQDFNHAGFWTTINRMPCYVVPKIEGWWCDGEYHKTHEEWVAHKSGSYWLGEFHSKAPFIVAGLINEWGQVLRRSAQDPFPSNWFWGEL